MPHETTTTQNGGNGATAAEREAELIALQSAFDEYIASSRELEEELDAELAKMRKLLSRAFRSRFHSRRLMKMAFLTFSLHTVCPQRKS